MKKEREKGRSLTRKQRQHIGLAVTALLSAVVVTGGFLAAFGMEQLVPSYKDQTHIRDITAGVGLLPGGENSIRSSLYPWTLYNPDEALPITDEARGLLNGILDVDGLLSMMLMDNSWELEDDGEKFWPSQMYDFSSRFTMATNENNEPIYFFLDNERVTLSSGKQVDVSCAVSMYTYPQLLYYAVEPVRDPQIDLSEEINSAYQKLKERFAEYEEKFTEIPEVVMDDEIVLRDLTGVDVQRFFMTMDNYNAVGVIDYFSKLLWQPEYLLSPEILRTEKELMLIYTAYNSRTVLFLDPLTLECCGMSIQGQ